jgi:hypothetical protein
MKYFTPELLSRVQSDDEDVSAAAHEQWDRAGARFKRRWQKIKEAFPEGVRRFEEATVCLHAAQVLSMGRQGDTFVMVLETEPPTRDLVILTFTLVGEPETEATILPDRSQSGFLMWLYEEWNLHRLGRYSFEALLSDGSIVRLRFRDFHFSILRQVWPAKNGKAAHTTLISVPPPV